MAQPASDNPPLMSNTFTGYKLVNAMVTLMRTGQMQMGPEDAEEMEAQIKMIETSYSNMGEILWTLDFPENGAEMFIKMQMTVK